MQKILLLTISVLVLQTVWGQEKTDSQGSYKKRVLDDTEIDFLVGYYNQDGDNAAVSGGKGTEELKDLAPTITVSIPMNEDDVLTVEAGISAYTSASSSNVNPFDENKAASPWQASSGASSSDIWMHAAGTYAHSSDDRNKLWSGKLSISSEFDYFSLGLGGSLTRLFHEKNTEISLSGNIFLDQWSLIYPEELRPFKAGGDGINSTLFTQNQVTGNPDYSPSFNELGSKNRNSYSLGFTFSQILSKSLQASLMADWVLQRGLLSTPFQRVYFADVPDSYIDEFQLADDIEQLPDSRMKFALGGRLNYYLNEIFVLRSFYRYYTDEWGIRSHTASLELPIKLGSKFTVSPSYRYYQQSAADYFAPYEQHLSTEQYYTSDYDLSKFNANQYGIGLTYTDVFTKSHIWKLKIKSIDLKYNYYERDSGFKANLISFGMKFIY